MLSPRLASYYQSLIEILCWIVELGRADIMMNTSAMASMMAMPRHSAIMSMMAMPRQGHLDVLFQMFSFLNTKHNDVMIFDPTDPDIYKTQFCKKDWTATSYGDCYEELPPGASKPRGIGFIM